MVLAANAGGEIINTCEHWFVRIQMNKIIPRASSKNPNGTTTSGRPIIPTPSNNEMQVEMVIEVPPFSLGHPIDA